MCSHQDSADSLQRRAAARAPVRQTGMLLPGLWLAALAISRNYLAV